MKKILYKSKFILLILIAVIINSIPLLGQDLDVMFDDGVQHIARSYSTYLSLKNGENSTVLSNLTNGFGYSWNLFYGNFSTNLILICYFFVRNFINAYKLTLFLGLLFSGITMYLLVSKLTKNKVIGTISAIIYAIVPYHLTDMYTRNALGEFLSYIFIPLVFLGIYNLINKEKGKFWLTVGAVGLIYTHNLSTIFTAFFAFIYLISNFKKLKDKEILKGIFINIIFIILITFAFWGPLLETKFYTDYAVYEKDEMSTASSLEFYALALKSLFYTDKSQYAFEIGIVIIILLFLPLVAIKRFWKDNVYKKEYILFLILGILCAIISTKLFPWKQFGKYFTLIQFPWRMLAFTNFFLAIVGGINVQIVIKNPRFTHCIFFVVVCTLTCIFTNLGVVQKNNDISDVEQWNIGFIENNKDIAIAGMGKGEYLPVKANNAREYISQRLDKIYILYGNAEVTDYNKNGQTMKANIGIESTNNIPTEKTVLELPYIYYPGYKVTLNEKEIETFESENGFIEVQLTSSGELEVSYPRNFYNESFKNHFNFKYRYIYNIYCKKINKNT